MEEKGGIAMTKELFISAITKFAAGVLLVGLLIFVPAGDRKSVV